MPKKERSKYFIPTVVVSLLLVIVTVLLLFIVFGQTTDNSTSKGNVIGNVSVEKFYEIPSHPTQYRGMLSASVPATVLRPVDPSEIITLSWLTDYEEDKTFSVSGLIPGDSVSKDYVINIKRMNVLELFFDTVIKVDSPLSNILELKVEFDGETAYDGLLKDAVSVRYPPRFGEIPCKLTVTMPTHDENGVPINNDYAKLSLTVDFLWWVTQAPPPVVGGGSETFMPINLIDSTLVGEKLLEGREWQDGDSFTFVLEYKVGDEEYTKLGERTVTSADEKIDFSKEFSEFMFEAATVYDFRITETSGNIEGVSYDDSEKMIQVAIKKSETSSNYTVLSLVGNGVDVKHDEKTDIYSLAFAFKNEYSDSSSGEVEIEDVEITIPIKNNVESRTPDGEDETDGVDGEGEGEEKEFIFVVENKETGEKTLVSIGDDGKGELKLKYTEGDIGKTFKYSIYPLEGKDKDVFYSAKKYELVAKVSLDESGNKLAVDLTLDGVPVKPEDISLEFDTVVLVTPKQEEETLKHIIIFPIILLVGELSWLYYILYVIRKKKNGVKLNSWATPVIFFSLLVPKWEAVLFVVLSCIALAMLAVDPEQRILPSR